MQMPHHPATDHGRERYDWIPDSMMLCWIVGILVVVVQGVNLIHAVSQVHESSEGCYSGSNGDIEGVDIEQYSGSDISFITPGLTCHYGGERFGTEVTTVDLTSWSPWIFWGGTAVLAGCLAWGLYLRRLHRLAESR